MSIDVNTDLGTLRICAGDVWLLWCAVCQDWEKLNEEQVEGRVSVNHAATGCPSGYHETHHFAIGVVAAIQAHWDRGGAWDDPAIRHANERPKCTCETFGNGVVRGNDGRLPPAEGCPRHREAT